MLTEVVLLKFIFWEIWCHTGYPTESLDVSTRKMDVDFPFCLLRGKVRGKKIPLVMGCYRSFIAYEKYQYQIWNGVLNTGTVHTFQHDDGSQDMPENDDFAIFGLANTISSWRCECA